MTLAGIRAHALWGYWACALWKGRGYAELVCRVDIAATNSDCIGPHRGGCGVRWGHAAWQRDDQGEVARHGDVAAIEVLRQVRAS